MCDFKSKDKKNITCLKAQIFIFFLKASTMRNQITNKNTDNSAT